MSARHPGPVTEPDVTVFHLRPLPTELVPRIRVGDRITGLTISGGPDWWEVDIEITTPQAAPTADGEGG